MSERNKGIKMSPKHGLNPSIPICFFCGKERNEVVLLGRIGDGRRGEDFEAPRRVLLDYEPCEDCKKKMAEGVLLVEVVDYPTMQGQPMIANDAYPTGRYVVVKPESLKGDFKAGSRALVLKSDFEYMFGMLQ